MGQTISICNPLVTGDFPSIPRKFVFAAHPFEGFVVHLDIVAFDDISQILCAAQDELINRFYKHNLMSLVDMAEGLHLEIAEGFDDIECNKTEHDEIVIYGVE